MNTKQKLSYVVCDTCFEKLTGSVGEHAYEIEIDTLFGDTYPKWEWVVGPKDRSSNRVYRGHAETIADAEEFILLAITQDKRNQERKQPIQHPDDQQPKEELSDFMKILQATNEESPASAH